jgi:hypothetical protein
MDATADARRRRGVQVGATQECGEGAGGSFAKDWTSLNNAA